MPRIRIAWVMAAIAVAAFNFAAIRAMFDYPLSEPLVFGALPMANVLALGILVGRRRPGSRPFLLGFVAFGATALALFVTFSSASLLLENYTLINAYLTPVMRPIEESIGQNRPFIFIPTALFAYVVMLGWPQLVFALIGGSLSRRYRITITRR
ncbi:MAG: hypothetical protein U0790_23300 [Isosphaeraceae bacterium]